MQFAIGTRIYVVRRKWNLRSGDDLYDGFCDQSTRTIWLRGELPPETIVDVLRHEHSHAWEFEVGVPIGSEDLAAFTSTVGEAFDDEFRRQGGIESLLAIPIEGTRPRGSNPAGTVQLLNVCDRIECPTCGATIMSGSIYISPAKLHDTGLYFVDRGCQCPICDTVQAWQERSTPDGLPLGEFCRARVLTGDEARVWRNAHRELLPYRMLSS